MASGLSDAFSYRARPTAAPAAAIQVAVPPFNKLVFAAGNEKIMINIPSGKRGQYLNTHMSYLNFELNVAKKASGVTPTADRAVMPVYALDGGAHALSRSLDVYHGSNLLEHIDNYNALYQLLADQGFTHSDIGRSAAEGISNGEEYGLPYNESTVTGEGTLGAGASIQAGTAFSTNVITSDLLPDGAKQTAFAAAVNNAITSATTSGSVNLTDGSLTYLSGDRGTVAKTRFCRAGQIISNVGYRAGCLAPRETAEGRVLIDKVSENDEEFMMTAPLQNTNTNYLLSVTDKDSVRTFTFCIPILSGVIGAQMPKYLPVGNLAADVRMELTLADFNQALVAVGAIKAPSGFDSDTGAFDFSTNREDIFSAVSSPAWKETFSLSNIEFMAEYVEVAANVQTAIENVTGGEYTMSFDSWDNFTNTITSNQQALTQLIGAKFSSVKDMTTIFRPAEFQNKVMWRGITSRVDPFANTSNAIMTSNSVAAHSAPYSPGVGWQYQIGATFYPSKPVNSNQMTYAEAVKNMHATTSASQPGKMDRTSWSVSARQLKDAGSVPKDYLTNPSELGTYYICQNLESQSHKSTLADSGVNTLAQTVYLSMRMPGEVRSKWYFTTSGELTNEASTGTGTDLVNHTQLAYINPNLQIDTFTHYDAVLLVRNGMLNTRF
eukprot:jgi/Tetstr1/459316/TSEL_004711.t1